MELTKGSKFANNKQYISVANFWLEGQGQRLGYYGICTLGKCWTKRTSVVGDHVEK